jgi:hypothetical protein
MPTRAKEQYRSAPSTLAGFETHIAYLRLLAGRLEGTDRSAVVLAADLLESVKDHFQKTGYLK